MGVVLRSVRVFEFDRNEELFERKGRIERVLVFPRKIELLRRVTEALKTNRAELFVDGEAMKIHFASHVKVDPTRVPEHRVGVQPERGRFHQIRRDSNGFGFVDENVGDPKLKGNL